METTVRNTPPVAVILLNFNKKEYALDCLRSVYQQEYPSYEVVFVDNASSDGSAEAVAKQFPNAQLVRSPVNHGAPGGRNLGYRYAKEHLMFQYAFFIDNDTVFEPGCIGEMVRALEEDPTAGIACPKAFRSVSSDILMSTGLKVSLLTATIYDIGSGDHDAGQFNERRYVDACGGFAYMVRKDLMEKLVELDEDFNPYGWEDVDFCLRAARTGFRSLFVPSARMCHKGGKSGRGIILKYERQKAKNFMLLMRKHAGPIEWLGGMLFAALKAVKMIAMGILKGQIRLAAFLFAGVLDGTSGRLHSGSADITRSSESGKNDKKGEET